MNTMTKTPIIFLSLLIASCGSEMKVDDFDPVTKVARVDSQDMLIGGRTARGKIGDYKIWNDKIAVIIQDVGLTSIYKRYGGVPLDADVIRDGQPGASQLGYLFFAFNQRLFEPDEIELIEATPENPRATIRATGKDAYFDWLGSFLGDVFSTGTIDCRLTYDYSLGPGDEALRIDITIENRSAKKLYLDMVEAAFIMGDGLKTHFPGPGFDTDDHLGEYPGWMGLGDQVCYGLVSEEGPLSMLMNYLNIAFGTYPQIQLGNHESLTITRHLAVAEGGLDRIQQIFRQVLGETESGLLSGQVTAPPEALAQGVRIHVLDQEGGHISVIVPEATGDFESSLAPGTYELIAKADGYNPSEYVPVEIEAGLDKTVSLDIPESTPFTYRISDGEGQLIPARLTFLRIDDAPENILDTIYGEERHPSGGGLVIHTGAGEGSGVIPFGTYEVIASRGFEYEMDRLTIESNGTELALDFVLPRVVDSSGYLSSDFHIHAQYSPDSSVFPEHRVRTALAENLENLVMTEHDTIRDFGPVVQSLGASSLVQAVVGSEITTYLYGHFNAWPLTEKPDHYNYGGIEWFDTWAPDLFQRIRDSESHDVIIQINHPRSAAIGGYFNALELDISSGTIGRWDNWTEDFDAIEVFNGGCSNGNREELQDWIDFINRGYRVSVSGGSDSHSEFSELGSPRVYLRSDHDVGDFTNDELVSNFRDMQVFVSCGPFIRFEIDGKGLGETLSTAGPVFAQVEVQAPSYMTLTEIRILRNGEVAWSLPASEWPPAVGALRFDDVVELDPGLDDCWYALEVKGSGNQQPITGDAPYAITNPIYIDVNQNGEFDPPLPPYSASN
jgi:carboxypeptidase family protein